MEKLDIKSQPLAVLTEWLADMGEPRYRAEQIFGWLHQKKAASFAEMTNLSAALRIKLEGKCYINSLNIEKRLVSHIDGTVKYLYTLADGNQVESVLMHHHHGTSLCVSTQVGCRMGCKFCASTIGGLVRNLTPAEILDQIYTAEKDSGKHIDGVVLMGIGEPLDNFDNVLSFLQILSSPKGQHMSLRHVSLSTCGLVNQIDALAEHRLPLTLSVSLHAPDNQSRSAIMPVNQRWPVEQLMAACSRYFLATGRRISFEYALIAGVNDTLGHAVNLAELLQPLTPCHVNLIPVNTVAERSHQRSSREVIRRFQQALQKRGINATVRRELGSDIAAACGQLRRESAASSIRRAFGNISQEGAD